MWGVEPSGKTICGAYHDASEKQYTVAGIPFLNSFRWQF
jgi:hypothetical protein